MVKYPVKGVAFHLGDCREVLATMPPESIDAIVTDPPYGLNFLGKDWDKPRPGEDFVEYFHGGDFQRWTFLWARQALRVLKPGGHMLVMAGTRLWHRTACGVEDAGFEVRDTVMWLYGTGFPKSLDVSKAIDKAAGAEREVVGHHPSPRRKGTDAARQWEGWGTALKPAWEPIILCRKPLEGTVAANVQEYGTGALSVDATRIRTSDRTERHNQASIGYGGSKVPFVSGGAVAGRWPANVVLDEEAAALLDAQSGELKSGGGDKGNKVVGSQGYGSNVRSWESGGHAPNAGGASRFFYCAKASRKERGEGNDHPTVKPIALMRWLARLVTPPNGVILDPFIGSGTTALAAVAEGFRCVGIDADARYLEIAQERITRG